MAIRDKIIERSREFLEPGEQARHVFVGQSVSGYFALITWLIFFFVKYRSVVVTDQRIVVLASGMSGKPKSVVRSLPRSTQIGPVSGLWAKTETLGEKLYVHKRFHKDIDAADASRPAT